MPGQSEEVRMEIMEFLLGLPEVYVFKNAEDEILLVYKDADHTEKKIQPLFRRFDDGWGKNRAFYVCPRWIYVPDSGIVNNVEDMLYMIRDIRQNGKEFSENPFLYVDKEKVEQMYRKKQTEQLIFNAMEKDWVEVY